MFVIRAVCATAIWVVVLSTRLFAQDVTLISPDRSVEISGTLLGFDGDYYRVDTVYGELTVDGSGVLCEGPGCPNLLDFVADLRLSGAASMGTVLMPALLESFAAKANLRAQRVSENMALVQYELRNRGDGRLVARFHFRNTTTDEGFADLLANEADIVMALREIRPPEATRAEEAGLGDLRLPGRTRVLALDALVPIVAPDNPLAAISTTDLAGVFTGKLTNWAQLGGPDAEITAYLRDARSGLGQATTDLLMAPIGASIGAGVQRRDSDSALEQAVVNDPFGIGLVAQSALRQAKPLALMGACGFQLSAARRSVKTEDYPLTTPMFLYVPARRLPKVARDFLTYLRSAPAQLVIRRAGFVDQTPEEIPINAQGQRLANAIVQAGPEVDLGELQRMLAVLGPLQRLTTTFRFGAGSARLDAQSSSNVQQLAQALEGGFYDARRLVFVGFSDGDGPARTNREIALQRAEAVRSAVLEAAETANLDRIEMQVDAFGEALPMACDDSAWGRQVNRRVEVWVR